jgi:16S rRNA (adenine1518-N6/adenine1519-N6)-dimethyltransferase
MSKYKANKHLPEVKAKKHLGQHFLIDINIAENIANALSLNNYSKVLEIGPGMGMLTDFLISKNIALSVIDIDSESISFLKKKYKDKNIEIIEGDFLQTNLANWSDEAFAVIGNFPYNISSQIFFHILDFKDHVPEIVCMLQKEVAQRLSAGLKSSDGGILSIFLQAYYEVEYLFTVSEDVFDPPPKVKSGVIRLKRNCVKQLDCNENDFRKVVKMAFNMRRKTLRNALKGLNLNAEFTSTNLFDKRAEQLSVDDFVYITNQLSNNRN